MDIPFLDEKLTDMKFSSLIQKNSKKSETGKNTQNILKTFQLVESPLGQTPFTMFLSCLTEPALDMMSL